MLNARNVTFRGPTAAGVNFMQGAIENLLLHSDTKRFSDTAKPNHDGSYAAVSIFPADDRTLDDSEWQIFRDFIPGKDFKGGYDEVRRNVAAYCSQLPKDGVVIIWSWVEGTGGKQYHVSEVYTKFPPEIMGMVAN